MSVASAPPNGVDMTEAIALVLGIDPVLVIRLSLSLEPDNVPTVTVTREITAEESRRICDALNREIA